MSLCSSVWDYIIPLRFLFNASFTLKDFNSTSENPVLKMNEFHNFQVERNLH